MNLPFPLDIDQLSRDYFAAIDSEFGKDLDYYPRAAAANTWCYLEDKLEALAAWLIEYKRNPGMVDLCGVWRNSSGSLSGYLWQISDQLPLTEFNERRQRFYLARGAITLSRLILEQMESPQFEPRGQLQLFPPT